MIWNEKSWGRLKWLGLTLILALVIVAGPAGPKIARPNVVQGSGIGVRVEAVGLTIEDVPTVNPNETWKVTTKERVSACDNRPGLKKIYVTVLDEKGEPLRGVIVRFDTHLSEGIAYDHMDIWGYTDENGYLEWDHLGKPTRYMVYMEGDEVPLIENIRTDLGNEYCKVPGGPSWSGNVPVNRPGIYSYRIEIQKKGEGE